MFNIGVSLVSLLITSDAPKPWSARLVSSFISPFSHRYWWGIDVKQHGGYPHRCSRACSAYSSHEEFYGLTEDGDFAILGINKEDTTAEYSSISNEQSVDANLSSLLAEKSFSSLLSIPTSNMKSLSLESSTNSKNTGGKSDLFHAYDHVNDEKLSVDDKPMKSNVYEVRTWLSNLMPTLGSHDLDSYTNALNSIGFHPHCASVSELKFEDLSFMKLLHRRYFFNKISR